MAQKIKFGTDGWRGAIAKDYTFENLKRCTQGFAQYMINHGKQGEWIVVGHDKRFLSEQFALAAAEVLAGNGFRVYLTDGPTPTPVISYSVTQKQAAGAINITASHNPPTDNGFKVRDENGGAIAPEGLKEIENSIPGSIRNVKTKPAAEAETEKKLVKFDAAPAYIDHLSDLINVTPIREAGLKIVVDAMWGNGAGWFSRLLGGSKTQILEIHNTRNPIFPEMSRPEPIQPNIDVGLARTKELKADVLIVTDGDADRLGIGDENGNFINQLQAYALLAYYLLDICGQRGPIVKTLSTTSMLVKLGKIYNVPVYETGVGFKYVAPKMLETDALIGGEESGGYAFRGNVPERDGILAGLYFLDLMVRTGHTPSQLLEQLFSIVGPHYYDRIDRGFTGDRKSMQSNVRTANPAFIAGMKVTGTNFKDGYKFILEDGGWMLIRFSGTEPIIRVYCETTHKELIPSILHQGLQIVGLE
jgi:alpha-D-glucose phosphate-specific phosphoglucomutase